MTPHDARIITNCPANAWRRTGEGGYTRMPHHCEARARVFAAMRCSWRRAEEGPMPIRAIAAAVGLDGSSVSHALISRAGGSDPESCRVWLEKWAGTWQPPGMDGDAMTLRTVRSEWEQRACNRSGEVDTDSSTR